MLEWQLAALVSWLANSCLDGCVLMHSSLLSLVLSRLLRFRSCKMELPLCRLGGGNAHAVDGDGDDDGDADGIDGTHP